MIGSGRRFGHDRYRMLLARQRELTLAEQVKLAGHLDRCPSCRRASDAYAGQDLLLCQLAQLRPHPRLRLSVFDRLEGDVPAGTRSHALHLTMPRGRASKRLVTNLACAALVVSAIWVNLEHHEQAMIGAASPSPAIGYPGTISGWQAVLYTRVIPMAE